MVEQLDMSQEMDVILGNEDFEKLEKRRVIIVVSLRFPKENGACGSDNLDDTVCYAKLSDFLNEKLRHSKFNLMEKMARFLYDEITSYLNDGTILKSVRVTKPDPPATNLKSASFICSDW